MYAEIFFLSIHEVTVKSGMNLCEFFTFNSGQVEGFARWDIAPHRWVIGACHFETACWFPLQGMRSPMKKNLLDSLTTEYKTIMLSENVGHQSPSDAALCPRISKTSGMNS